MSTAVSEIRIALNKIKNHWASGDDRTVIEAIKLSDNYTKLADLLT